MNQLVTWILFILMILVGGGVSLYLVVSLPVVIIWKIYRCIHYGYKFTD